MNKFSVSAILCAAGTSARMGDQNKLLLPYSGKSIINHCVTNLLAAEIDELIVVLGHQFEELNDDLQLFSDRIKIVKNDEYKSGQTSSIKCGVSAMHDDHTSFLICLGDMPLITTSHYDQIIGHFRSKKHPDGNMIARPIFQGIPGHPVIMSTFYKQEILDCKDREGCLNVIKRNTEHLSLMRTTEKCYIQDTDTPKSYKSLIDNNL